MKDVSRKECEAITELAGSSSVDTENGSNVIAFRDSELSILRRYYSEIAFRHNGIVSLRFLQTELTLGFLENLDTYSKTGLNNFRFNPAGLPSDRAREMKYAILSKALSLSPEKAMEFLPLYTRYESECEELLGEQYSLYGLFGGEASDFTPGLAKRQGHNLLALMERELRLKEKYFNEITVSSGPALAAGFLAWEDFYSLGCKLNSFADAR